MANLLTRIGFIDETSVKTNMAKTTGWAPRGQRLIDHAPFGSWQTQTLIAALRHDRLDAPWVIDGPINRDLFDLCIETQLAPTLQPGNVIILDNLSYQRCVDLALGNPKSGFLWIDVLPLWGAGMSGIEIMRSEFTASDFRMAAGKRRDAKAARRMLALALVLEGVDRTRAAQTCGMDRQTLRDWVHRYNAEGLAGLSDRRKGVRVPRLVPAQMADLAAWVEAGPDPEKDGVVRWRRQDLQRRTAEAFGVEVPERTVGKYLAALGYRRLSVRPQHPRTDPGAQETFKKTSARP